ncbi:MAG: sugar phosphate isomerase/epimerase, partial [Porticoccaceae bacterium]|nr:sugar phosphate isomerase/epimerase [Porticoccaceae bacterium]
LLLWTDEPARKEFWPLYQRLAEMGFDGLELPIMHKSISAYKELGRVLNDLGLACTATSICTPEADPISPDKTVRQNALDELKKTLDCCQAVGATLLGGPIYAAIGQFSGTGPTQQEWDCSQEILAQAADYAAHNHIQLSLEFLNRFEIYLLNTCADTARFVSEVGRDNLGVHYDSFHAHIEEKSPVAAIAAAGSSINHVHLSENDRGTPGTGHVDWVGTFNALRQIDYQGWLTIEAFGQGLPTIAAATKVWRPLFDSEEQLARDGLKFVKAAYQEARA